MQIRSSPGAALGTHSWPCGPCSAPARAAGGGCAAGAALGRRDHRARSGFTAGGECPWETPEGGPRAGLCVRQGLPGAALGLGPGRCVPSALLAAPRPAAAPPPLSFAPERVGALLNQDQRPLSLLARFCRTEHVVWYIAQGRERNPLNLKLISMGELSFIKIA